MLQAMESADIDDPLLQSDTSHMMIQFQFVLAFVSYGQRNKT